MKPNQNTIFALATGSSSSAIATFRISGNQHLQYLLPFIKKPGSSIHPSIRPREATLIHIFHDGQLLDEAILTYFQAPASYTREDVSEICCHGSTYIINQLSVLLSEIGFQYAEPGEFTKRAFLNGRMDLSQAEAVNDLIQSGNKTAHDLAMQQMRGGFSLEIRNLRSSLIEISSLLELELDFSEEDVEFANRADLQTLINKTANALKNLSDSFAKGNVLKNGIPTVILGRPNVGKSTLLNALLNEEKAIVSEIPGTTRDAIEDVIHIDGYAFRFIDTAGLRETKDAIETMGINRTMDAASKASLLLYVADASQYETEMLIEDLNELKSKLDFSNKKLILIFNKTDLAVESPKNLKELLDYDTVFISAKRKENLSVLEQILVQSIVDHNNASQIMITNIRHYDALRKTENALADASEGLKNKKPTDLIAEDLRIGLHYLGLICGDIAPDDILGEIFSHFCIGK